MQSFIVFCAFKHHILSLESWITLTIITSGHFTDFSSKTGTLHLEEDPRVHVNTVNIENIAFYSPVQDRFTAAVKVVKFLFSDRVVDIHGRDTQLSSFG